MTTLRRLKSPVKLPVVVDPDDRTAVSKFLNDGKVSTFREVIIGK